MFATSSQMLHKNRYQSFLVFSNFVLFFSFVDTFYQRLSNKTKQLVQVYSVKISRQNIAEIIAIVQILQI